MYYQAVIYQCECCGEPIVLGDTFFELTDGRKFCTECVKERLAKSLYENTDSEDF